MTNNDWTLTPEQITWMMQHANEIDDAYRADDTHRLDILSKTADYRALFGDMPFDEAIDRWELSGVDE